VHFVFQTCTEEAKFIVNRKYYRSRTAIIHRIRCSSQEVLWVFYKELTKALEKTRALSMRTVERWTSDFRSGPRISHWTHSYEFGRKQLQIKHILINLKTFWKSQKAGQQESMGIRYSTFNGVSKLPEVWQRVVNNEGDY
jgi:hypothetical protein